MQNKLKILKYTHTDRGLMVDGQGWHDFSSGSEFLAHGRGGMHTDDYAPMAEDRMTHV